MNPMKPDQIRSTMGSVGTEPSHKRCYKCLTMGSPILKTAKGLGEGLRTYTTSQRSACGLLKGKVL